MEFRPQYKFGSTADLAFYCEEQARHAHQMELSARTKREAAAHKATFIAYRDIASLIRDAQFASEVDDTLARIREHIEGGNYDAALNLTRTDEVAVMRER